MGFCKENSRIHRQISFTGVTTFCLNGTVNRQNCRYYSMINPHWILGSHTQHLRKLNMWAGIVANRMVGTFFSKRTITEESYSEFLQNDFIPALAEIQMTWILLSRLYTWFQPRSRCPGQLLTYDVKGRRIMIEWPERSPDLAPLDNFYGVTWNSNQ